MFGHGNYGNEATLAAVLARLDPTVFNPLLLTINPAEASSLHGVPAKSVGAPAYAGSGSRFSRVLRTLGNRLRYLVGAVRTAQQMDSIVIVGTGGLERTGAFGTPFEIWSLAVASRIFRRSFVLLNIGVDAPRDRISRFFIRTSGRFATYRSYRDTPSRNNMAGAGLSQAASDPVVTDLAFDVRPPRSATRDASEIVVGVMDYQGPDSADHSARTAYNNQLRALISALLVQNRIVTIVSGDDADLEVAHALASHFSPGRVSVSTAKTSDQLVQALSHAGAVIATRYHTLIFALMAGTPVVSIGYSTKHRAMLDQLDLPAPHSDASTFDPSIVASQARFLASETDALRTRIDSGVDNARLRLSHQWPELLTHIGHPGVADTSSTEQGTDRSSLAHE
ncbi:polysaccharide pyruvyl transferase WcaK-like protein [Paramicrobacterium agarici]|nr:polysaccharide pyruvyl transferase family protein [Microbacterium agarici]TQO23468.1 polysaccharide pyruvyl transferase WcaK-like protein [Microbacterium agarici]